MNETQLPTTPIQPQQPRPIPPRSPAGPQQPQRPIQPPRPQQPQRPQPPRPAYTGNKPPQVVRPVARPPQVVRPNPVAKPVQITRPAPVIAKPTVMAGKPVAIAKPGLKPSTSQSLNPQSLNPQSPPSGAPMQGNLSINFSQKNNPKKSYASHRPARQTGEKLSSEAFLRHRDVPKKEKVTDPHKLIKKDEVPVRIVPLGGLEQIGINMTVIEYKTDIIIVDSGIQFATVGMHGVDYVIPDISYLIPKKKNIRGILVTHGHLDHIGALKHILPELDFPLVYTSPLSVGLIKKSMDDKDVKKLKYKLVDPDMDILKLGAFTVEIFRVNHSIPESLGFSIHTPKGLIVTAGDYKIDHTPSIDKPADIGKISRIGQEGVKIFMGESTNATRPGHSISEKIIGDNLDGIIRDCKTRMIVSTFASNIGRLMQIIDAAVKYNKVVFLAGRSMINNVRLCQELGYITAPEKMIRQIGPDIDQLADERVLVLCTGSQGEEFSALVRMANKSYKDFELRPGDSVMLSSHTIPGNEKAVIDMINDLVAIGLEIMDDSSLDIHSSGHGYQEDIKMMMAMLKPEYYMPVHGEIFMRHANEKIALSMNIPQENILIPFNGQIVELYDDIVLVSEKKIKLDTIMIDGKGQGHLSGEYVMKARSIMSENGMVGLIFKVDTKTGELVGNVQIESRGFVYSSEVKSIHTQIVDFARAKYNDHLKKKMDIKDNLKQLKEDLGEFIAKIIGRVPMLMTMFVYINREAQAKDIPPEEAIIGSTLDEQGYDD